MDITLQIVKERKRQRYIAIGSNGSMFTINEIMYLILLKQQERSAHSDIALYLNDRFNCNRFDETFVQEIAEAARLKISEPGQVEKMNSRYVFFNRVIIKEGAFTNGYRLLSKLFNKFVFVFLASFSVVLTALFFYRSGLSIAMTAYHEMFKQLSVAHILVFYGCFIGIVIIHELGHASASYRFGVMPKEIGIGIYFVLPVFYTNVTGIWVLNAMRRIIVNLAGIYFQLIVNLVLLLLISLHVITPFCFALLVANTISLLSALNPFFRYDGYWIYSDFFQLANLKKQVQSFFVKIFFRRKETLRSFNWPLCLYSIGNAVFWYSVYFAIARFLVANVKKWYVMATQGAGEGFHLSFDTMFSFCITLLLGMVLTNLLIMLFKNLVYEIKHVHQQA